MFDAPTISFEGKRKDYGEKRMICYGVIDSRVHCYIYTDRDDMRRIISLRKANAYETRDYVQNFIP